MPSSSLLQSTTEPPRKPSWIERLLPVDLLDDSIHPVQIALRTYAVSLSLSLGPSLLPFIVAPFRKEKHTRGRARSLGYVLKRELGPNGFAFAITVAVGGGAALQRLWQILEEAGQDTDNDSLLEQSDLSAVGSGSNSLESQLWVYRELRWIASGPRRAFACNLISSAIAILLLQGKGGWSRSISTPIKSIDIPLTIPIDANATKHGSSPTLDLTLLLLVRAVDAIIQCTVFRGTEIHLSSSAAHTIDILGSNGEVLVSQAGTAEARRTREEETEWRQKMTTRLDAFIFWACSGRIMWCFFYEPRRLPASYVKWINSLAHVDQRLLHALRALRKNDWSYIRGSPTHSHLLTNMARDLGYPPSWGDPAQLPAFGGTLANATWRKLGVASRPNVGGFPCEIVHGGLQQKWGLGNSCTGNAAIRIAVAFVEAMALYLPVHFLPIFLTRPSAILRVHRVVLPTILHACRSAAFLSTFVSSCWYGVCLTRSILLARLFPWISHDVWDGPYGCMMIGSLLCGSSIWIENGKRRGEMALYVLPRAIRSLFPYKWMRSGNRGIKPIERIVFIVSLASLLTAAVHRPDSLRGLSRWTFAFVMKGPNAGFWKRRKIMAQTPVVSTPRTPTPALEPLKSTSLNRT
ncbi:hypothetical protein PILCRDRAFT_817207 [Piloderma croceum F 1598]|uniref:Transmembrane protein 135 N-terminal domain-containing protein n=1 Tax=Piloderma croceum (strain F 1598) TaxID=765440 RepID=A0A0C3BG05_PILCF|nr:hypothetical protein PILCRDRAFT_817207 [Piloderma croceum F 1598]